MGGRTTWVAGVDGCRAGWVVVVRPIDIKSDARPRVVLLPRIADVLELDEQPSIIAVDMPIGLPERSGIGGRAADIAVRAHLGQRQSAVFAVPARAAIAETDYRRACDAAFAHSDPPRKVAKQTFNLFSKIRELDVLMTPVLQDRIVECHPEAAFWAMNRRQPLPLPKKVKSRPNEPGLALRRQLLEASGMCLDFLTGVAFRTSDCGADDVLDACACAWSAGRILLGSAVRFPDIPPHDPRGLRQEIWA